MPPDHLVSVAHPENAEKQEKMDLWDVKVDADQQDHAVQWENQDKMELWAHQENLVTQDLMVKLENKDPKVFKVFLDFRD